MKKLLTLGIVCFLLLSCSAKKSNVKKDTCPNFKHSTYEKCEKLNKGYRITQKSHQAFFDVNGTLILDFQYETIVPHKDFKTFIVSKNKKYALVDREGNLLIDFIYDAIYFRPNGKVLVKKEKFYGLLDAKYKELLPTKYEGIDAYNHTITLDNKKGIINKEGKIVVPCIYRTILRKKNGYFFVSENQDFALMSDNYEVLTAFKYPYDFKYLIGNLFLAQSTVWEDPGKGHTEPVMMHGHSIYALMNDKGIILSPMGSSMVKVIPWGDEKRVVVSNSKGVALYNIRGEIVIPFGVYDSFSAERKEKSLIKVSKGELFGYINLEGKIIVPLKYKHLKYWAKGFIMTSSYENDTLHGLYSAEGKEILAMKYGRITKKGQYLIAHTIHGYVGLYTMKGEELLSPLKKYLDIGEVISKKGNALLATRSEKGCCSRLNKLYNIHSKSFKELEVDGKKVYGSGGNAAGFFFGSNYFLAYTKTNAGVLDEDLKVIIPFKYQGIFQYRKGRFIAAHNDKRGVIGIDNNVIIPFQYDDIEFTSSFNYYVVTKNQKLGLLDEKAQEVLPLDYEQITTMYIKNRFKVRKNGKVGIVDKNNEVIVPLLFDYIKYKSKTKQFSGNFFKGKNNSKLYDINGINQK